MNFKMPSAKWRPMCKGYVKGRVHEFRNDELVSHSPWTHQHTCFISCCFVLFWFVLFFCFCLIAFCDIKLTLKYCFPRQSTNLYSKTTYWITRYRFYSSNTEWTKHLASINSLWPVDVIWRQRPWSALVEGTGLSPIWRPAISWTSAEFYKLETNFNDNRINI